MDVGGTGMTNLSKLRMPMKPLRHISAFAPMWRSQRNVVEGVYWALVVATAAEARRQLQSKGRPPVRQWRGATTAGGVLKDGLPEAAWSGLERAYIWES